jgi:D-methionine transport system substrate-binding protein
VLFRSLIAALAALTVTGCPSPAQASSASGKDGSAVTLKVGASLIPHSEILKKAKPILAADGVELIIIEIEDVITPNTGLAEGSLDANFFQHQPYLNDFNTENNAKLVSVGAVHYEPFGIYAGKTKDISKLPDGGTVAVPNNVANEARALVLLEQAGLLKLKKGVGIKATIQDITENSKNIKFHEIAPEQLVRSLPDVDVAVINGNYAIEGGLHLRDALVVESDQSIAAKTYANILVTRADNQNNPAVQKLIQVLQSPEIKTFIEKTYDGAVVPIR